MPPSRTALPPEGGKEPRPHTPPEASGWGAARHAEGDARVWMGTGSPRAPAGQDAAPPAQTVKGASRVVGGNRLQIAETRRAENSCRLVPTGEPLRTSTARGARTPPRTSEALLRLPESREEPSAFRSLSQSGEVSARLGTLPRHRRANGQRPARCPGALRAPPKPQSRQPLLPRTGLQVAGKSQVPSDLRPGRGFQGCCAPLGAPGPSPPASVTQVPRNWGVGPGWARAPAQRACSDPAAAAADSTAKSCARSTCCCLRRLCHCER